MKLFTSIKMINLYQNFVVSVLLIYVPSSGPKIDNLLRRSTLMAHMSLTHSRQSTNICWVSEWVRGVPTRVSILSITQHCPSLKAVHTLSTGLRWSTWTFIETGPSRTQMLNLMASKFTFWNSFYILHNFLGLNSYSIVTNGVLVTNTSFILLLKFYL